MAAEASGTLPLMKVSDYLTALAEAMLNYVLEIDHIYLVTIPFQGMNDFLLEVIVPSVSDFLFMHRIK